MSENRFLGNISASSFRNLLPKSVSTKKKLSSSRFKQKMNSENVAPIDPNIQISDPPLLPTSSMLKKPVLKTIDTDTTGELTRSVAQEQTSEAPDPPVKVVARIRPANGIESGSQAVRKVSDTSVCVGDRKFNFDMVFGSNSNQEDIFQSVGAPLVKDALAGYNTSLLAYGQTGSGKTYTMWGPPSSIVEVPSPNNGLQGIVPRIFQTLFSSIQKEQENSEGKQINYQCRCSFLEIYDEHIGDLLDPTQRNLKIMDDPRVGFYVENITEEYVSTYEDVSQMLIKGLSSRKVGSTSINSKSSRSHIVFTCVIESWCKESSSTCFGSSKMSRMSLVDLAGFDKKIPDDAGKQFVKEGKYVKKSTSLLGHLVNVLSERSQSRKLEDVSYSSSTLTHLMRESLGGNAKLSVICAISPENKHNSETVSTLRFGKRVKLIPNEPLVNEITEDDVNGLSDQIRQLKEELIRARSSASISVGSNYGSFRGPNVRESLNQLRVSLNRSLILPNIDNEREEEEVQINEDDIKELQLQIDNLRGSRGNNSNSLKYSSGESEHYLSCSEESEGEEINSEEILEETLDDADQEMETMQPEYCSSISIGLSRHSADLPGPVLSESPKFRNMQRKSLIISSEDNIQCSSKSSELPSLPQKQDLVQSSLRSSRIFPGPTESLAASLHRGLEIIDYHQRNSASNKSLVSFSFEHLAVNPSPISNDKANASIQTSSEEGQTSPFVATSFLCPKCKTKATSSSVVKDSTGTWMVPMEVASTEQDSEKVLFQALEREKQLESVCKDQADKLEQLNQRLALCKCTKEQSSVVDCGKDVVDLHDNENQASIIYQNGSQSPNIPKLLKWDDESPEPEAAGEKYETKEIQGNVENCGGKKLFDMAEREALLKEIGGLRSQLKSDGASTNKSIERTRSSLLAQSMQLRKSGVYAATGSGEELEKERERWTEMESEWICLTDELRIDLEAYRQRAEKVAMELMLEKKCTDELDDALKRSVLGQARIIEHYAELQEKYNDLAEKHKLILQGIQDVKNAAAKAGKKGHGARFAKSLAAELSALRVEREREREMLKKENKSLRVQLKDTAEAVHAAGELLVRLREAEETASLAEENFTQSKEENERLKKQIEKLKRKHKMEMITMKQYLAESRLPEAALRPPIYRQDSDVANNDNNITIQHSEYDDDQSWRAEFGAIYQEHI